MFQKYILNSTPIPQEWSRSVEQNWNFFHTHCLKVTENHVSVKFLGTRSHLPWLTSSLQHMVRKKQ